MQPKFVSIIILLVNVNIFINVHGNESIDYHVVRSNTTNDVVFIVLDGKQIKLPNHHRQYESTDINQLKLTLNGAQINQIQDDTLNGNNETNNNSTECWTLHLTDNSMIGICQIIHEQNAMTNTTEYRFEWQLTQKLFSSFSSVPSLPQVCFHYDDSPTKTYWYSAGTHYHSNLWPINYTVLVKEHDNISNPLNTIQENIYLSTNGFGIFLKPFEHENEDWSIKYRYDDLISNDSLMCISIKHTNDSKIDPIGNHHRLALKFNLYTSNNIQAVTNFIVTKSGAIPVPTELPPIIESFRSPIWHITDTSTGTPMFTTETVQKFVENFEQFGLPIKSDLLLTNWHHDAPNELQFDRTRFEHPSAMITNIHERGHQITLKVRDNFHPSTIEYHHLEQFITDKNDSKSSNNRVIDFRHSRAIEWYRAWLIQLQLEHQLDGICFVPFINDDEFVASSTVKMNITKLWLSKALETIYSATEIVNNDHDESNDRSQRLIQAYTYGGAFRTQHLPIINILPPPHSSNSLASSDDALQQTFQNLIPSILAASIGGYSWVAPFPIGWWHKEVHHKHQSVAYIRAVQATALMPIMYFDTLPSSLDDYEFKIVRNYIDLHQKCSDLFVQLAKFRIRTGVPIIRPLWYQTPDDVLVYNITTQYTLGDDIVVAPIIELDKKERQVYLPTGRWIDQRGGEHTGPGWIHVIATLEDLPYFVRKH